MTPAPPRAKSIEWRCPVCGIDVMVPGDYQSITCHCGYHQMCNPPGLGDRVAAWLAWIGITAHRYKRLKKAIGLRPECQCKKRQQELNELA